ncbi:MlaD family protein, partial [Jongsikchunia kroppenstedtii]|uniref:MlaD family protein n=1 Tax=Jongsikchunia kroppenstedtii TaxID=1121721 RepID=UPI0003768AD3
MPAPIDHSGRGPSAGALRRRGLLVLLVIAAVVAGYLWYVNRPPSGQEDFTVITTSAGDALNTQTQVRMRGLVVGKVTDVQQDSAGDVRVRMRVDRARFAELRQPLQTRFVSSNFFSSTAMELVPGEGLPVAAGQVIDLKTGVGDYTVTTLISQAGNTIVGSLTPQLTETIKRGSRLLAG